MHLIEALRTNDLWRRVWPLLMHTLTSLLCPLSSCQCLPFAELNQSQKTRKPVDKSIKRLSSVIQHGQGWRESLGTNGDHPVCLIRIQKIKGWLKKMEKSNSYSQLRITESLLWECKYSVGLGTMQDWTYSFFVSYPILAKSDEREFLNALLKFNITILI